MNDWIYMGIFLDDDSKDYLKKYYSLPKDWKGYYDHMTIVFNDGTELSKIVKEINDKHIGKRCTIRVVAIGISEKAIAVKVELPLGIVCANKIPHITLGVAPGCKPVDSNDITIWNKVSRDFAYLTGSVEVVKKDV